MKRVPLLDQHFEWGKGEHPDADKPLSAFQSITAICDDCGHASVLDRNKLLDMSAVPNFGTLWRHAYCAPCRTQGVVRTSVMLHPMPIDRNPELRAVKPIKLKPVFTNERSDPTPNLPRRSIFDRRMSQLERMK